METVSVIVPVYNNQNTLAATLDSILQQDYRPIEVIVVDDHSDDESYAFAKAYAQKHQNSQLKFHVQQNSSNLGAGTTRNHALSLATGRYMAFLDADDLWKPKKLTTQIQTLQEGKFQVSYAAYEIFAEDPQQPIAVQEIYPILTYERLHKSNYLGNLTGLYDTKVLGKIPIPAMRKRQDWAMWLDVLKKGGPAVGIQEPMASYRLSAGLSASKWDLISYNYGVYRQHLGYSWWKSCWLMLLFFYEQFLVKRKMRKAL